jgi:hypothetical protein
MWIRPDARVDVLASDEDTMCETTEVLGFAACRGA